MRLSVSAGRTDDRFAQYTVLAQASSADSTFDLGWLGIPVREQANRVGCLRTGNMGAG